MISIAASAQQTGISGKLKDASTDEALIGANILLSNGKGAVTDTTGSFFIPADSGSYTVQVSYLGYNTQTIKASVGKKTVVLNIPMESKTLKAVEVVADIARNRETPVAFTNISQQQIKEDLASRDIPMLLNSTPGVYATGGGGGSGDSRITMRGFNQQNIGVLVDGIPVNDMENSQVYWSNWDGLGDITRTIQIQRGLGASKLAIASVGGTINIITKGLESKRAISYSQEYGSDMLLKESLAMTTGRMKGDWGITVAGSRKTGNGWVDQTPNSAWSYFFKAEKRFKNHLVSIGANGAPQSHGQRIAMQPITSYDRNVAWTLGIDTVRTRPRGTAYNTHWGPLDRFALSGTDTTHHNENLNERTNYFHKPLFNLSDYWTINDKLYLSTVLYASFGSGGGTALNSPISPNILGQLNYQPVYNANYNGPFSIDINYSNTEHKSGNWIRSSVNNHKWFGGLMTLNYKVSKVLSLTTGLDMRWYNGTHYYQVYDLLGGNYIIDFANKNQTTPVKHLNDIYGKNYDGFVKYGGVFLQGEFVKEKWSAFMTLTGVETGYQRTDNFKLPTDSTRSTPWKWFTGYSTKAGANYNLTEKHNIYLNAGYIVKAPPFNNVYDVNNKVVLGVDNQKIASVEIGYGFKSTLFAANLNGYYTDWKNKPMDFPGSITINGDPYSYNINGLNALHKGVELDFVFMPFKKLSVGGIVSLGDWKWNSSDTARVYDNNGNIVSKVPFDARGVHVGNAAQVQYGGYMRYEPVKNLYVKAQFTYFANNFTDINPLILNKTSPYYAANPGGSHDSWQMPDYGIMDVHAGYSFRCHRFGFNVAGHLLNAFNNLFIADGLNGYTFTAKSANVFFGPGRRFLVSMKITFM